MVSSSELAAVYAAAFAPGFASISITRDLLVPVGGLSDGVAALARLGVLAEGAATGEDWGTRTGAVRSESWGVLWGVLMECGVVLDLTSIP